MNLRRDLGEPYGRSEDGSSAGTGIHRVTLAKNCGINPSACDGHAVVIMRLGTLCPPERFAGTPTPFHICGVDSASLGGCLRSPPRRPVPRRWGSGADPTVP